MTTIVTGEDKDDNDNGGGSKGNEVDNDCDNDDYGDGRRQQQWRRRDGQWRDGI